MHGRHAISANEVTDRATVIFFLSSDISTILGGAVKCTQVKNLESRFRSLRTLRAHPSQLDIGVLSSSISVAPPSKLALT